MKHCPKCTNEFVAEAKIERCPDCDVPLEPGPNPRLDGTVTDDLHGDLKVLTKVLHVWQADLLRGRLESAGIITAQNPSGPSAWMHIPPVEVTQVIEILINEEDYERGIQFLEEDPELLFCMRCYGQVSEEDVYCPHCGRKLEHEDAEHEEGAEPEVEEEV